MASSNKRELMADGQLGCVDANDAETRDESRDDEIDLNLSLICTSIRFDTGGTVLVVVRSQTAGLHPESNFPSSYARLFPFPPPLAASELFAVCPWRAVNAR